MTSNLHPINRGENIPNWNAPGWQPVPYPPKETFSFRPLTAEEVQANQQQLELSKKLAVESAVLWPTISDYLLAVYEKAIEGQDLQRWFEPRRIVPPGGYQSPKLVSALLFSSLLEVAVRDRANQLIMPIEITTQVVAYRVLQYQVPIFFVADSFIRAVAATDLPKDFTLMDLHWPMPGIVFGFPRKFMQDYVGYDICYVLAGDFPSGDYAPPEWLILTKIGRRPSISCPDKVAWQFFKRDSGRMESFASSFFKKDRVDETLNKYGYTDYTDACAEKVAEDKQLNAAISSLLMKLLVVLNTRQHYVERGAVMRPAKINRRTGKKEQTELWSPNLIGFTFKPQREVVSRGERASPRPFWRRGHLTHQRIGSVEGFVSINSLPVISEGENMGAVDWLKVAPDVREAFWRCHKRIWLEPVLCSMDGS